MLFNLLRKSSDAITNSRELDEYLKGSNVSTSGIVVTDKNAMQLAAVFTCVRVLCETVGNIPLGLYKRTKKRRDRVVNHPIHRLITLAPNDYQTIQDFSELLILKLLLKGNFYAFNNFVGNKLMEVLPLDNDCVTVRQNENWEVEYEVTYPSGDSAILRGRDITHIKLLSLDGLEGLSVIQQLKHNVGLGISSQTYAGNFYKEGAVLSGLLSTDKMPVEKDRKDIKKEWNSVYTGTKNQFRTAVLFGGMKYQPISISPDDAKYIETHKLNRSEIAGAFRVPPHLIGDMEKATYSNIEQNSLDFIVLHLMPLLRRLELGFMRDWLSEAEQVNHYFKHNVNGLLRGDMKSRAAFYKEMRLMGVYNADDICEMEDRNPLPDGQGQKYIVPINYTTLDKIGELPVIQPPSNPPPSNDPDKPDDEDEDENNSEGNDNE